MIPMVQFVELDKEPAVQVQMMVVHQKLLYVQNMATVNVHHIKQVDQNVDLGLIRKEKMLMVVYRALAKKMMKMNMLETMILMVQFVEPDKEHVELTSKWEM